MKNPCCLHYKTFIFIQQMKPTCFSIQINPCCAFWRWLDCIRSVVVNSSRRFTHADACQKCWRLKLSAYFPLQNHRLDYDRWVLFRFFWCNSSQTCWTAAWKSACAHYRYSLWCVLPTAPPRRFSVFSHHKEEMTDYRLLPEYISVCGLPWVRIVHS